MKRIFLKVFSIFIVATILFSALPVNSAFADVSLASTFYGNEHIWYTNHNPNIWPKSNVQGYFNFVDGCSTYGMTSTPSYDSNGMYFSLTGTPNKIGTCVVSFRLNLKNQPDMDATETFVISNTNEAPSGPTLSATTVIENMPVGTKVGNLT